FPYTTLFRSSGLRHIELLRKQDRSGLFLKTLLVCSPFWSRKVYLKWKSKRLSFFVRTMNRKQIPPLSASSSESLEALFQKLSQQDIYYRNSKMAPQSFCVFQLAPSMPRTGGTGSGLLPTPVARDWKGPTPGREPDNLPGAVK